MADDPPDSAARLAARRRLRPTILMLMALVAAAAISAVGWREYWRLSDLGGRYAIEATLSLEREETLAATLRAVDGRLAELDSDGDAERAATLRGFGRKLRARVEHAAKLRRKYQEAARRPWLPVEPDPPGPR